jgi:hypothetical protein
MSEFQEEIIKEFKSYIEYNDLSGAILFYDGLICFDAPPDLAWDYIYQKVYLHACLKKRRNFVDWLKTLYERLDDFGRIALRQMFAYGNYLLEK